MLHFFARPCRDSRLRLPIRAKPGRSVLPTKRRPHKLYVGQELPASNGSPGNLVRKVMTMKTCLLVLAALLAVGSATHAQQTPEFVSTPNFVQVGEQFYIGGQPAMNDLARLKARGIRAIVNLRVPAEYNAAEEEAKAKELGLRYFNIPVNPANLQDSQVEQFLKITSDRQNQPAFIHCAGGPRAAAFWMIRRVLVSGWKIEDAETEAQKMGLRNPALLEFARNYIARHPKKASSSIK